MLRGSLENSALSSCTLVYVRDAWYNVCGRVINEMALVQLERKETDVCCWNSRKGE
jgi:hypothetical protein